jgi:hypothetical protein
MALILWSKDMIDFRNRSPEETEHYIKFIEDFGEFFSNKIECERALVPDFMLSIVLAMLSDAGVTQEEFNDITKNLNIKYSTLMDKV